MSYYLHKVPGRLRVKLPRLRNHPQRSRRVRDLLEAQLGVEVVTANEVTGSVLVYYDCDLLGEQEILDVLRDNGWFDDRLVVSADAHIDRVATKAGHAVGRAMAGWIVGKALEANGLSLLAALI